MNMDRSLSGIIMYAAFVIFLFVVLIFVQPVKARDWPSPSFTSCFEDQTGTFKITVQNQAGNGYVSYDIYTEAGRRELGFVSQGQVQEFAGIKLEGNDPDLLRIWVSLDGITWMMNGETHSLNRNQAQVCPALLIR